MNRYFLKSLFVASVLCVSANGFASTVECDTIKSANSNSVVFDGNLKSTNHVTDIVSTNTVYANQGVIDTLQIYCKLDLKGLYDNNLHATKKCTELPVFRMWRSGYSQYAGIFSMEFDPNAIGYTDFIITHHGYPTLNPITFNASKYTFNFDGNGVMTVNGKIVCKEELKVAEVNTEQINAKEINVALNQAADYVFDEQYPLQPLNEVEAYVKENKHLPGIPSAEEFSAKGMNVSEMSNLLLEKVEELTLHLIQMQKEMELLKAKNEELERKCNMK